MIASIGADREGNSYNVNADEAAGAVARALGAYKVMFLTDVAGWLRDPSDPESVISEAGADEVEAALGRRRRRHAAEARGVPGRDPRRRLLRAHRRRPRAALAAARAVHRRGHRHEDQAGSVSGLPRRAARSSASTSPRLRAPARRVRARRGRAAVGRRRRRVPRLPDRHSASAVGPLPPARRRGDPHAGRAAAPRRQPLLHRAGDARWPSGWPSARWAARCTSPTPAPRRSRRRSSSRARQARRRRRRRCSGAFHGRTYGALSATPQESKQAPFAPLVPGFRAVEATAEAVAAAVDEPDRGRAARAGAGRGRRARAARRAPARARAACDEHGAR